MSVHHLRNIPQWPSCLMGLVVGLCVFTGVSMTDGAAEESTATSQTVLTQVVTGTVMSVDLQGISIEYAKKGYESNVMMLPVDKHAALLNLKNLSDLKRGDTVMVRYEQTSTTGADGEPIILKTVATSLTLIQPPSTQATSVPNPSSAKGSR